jgi:cytochrome c peroxidase
MLFYETRISIDGTVSCARCHLMSLYGIDGLKKSIGNNAKINTRNAPSVLNAAGQISQRWRGDRTSVEDQAKKSVIGKTSFGMPSYESIEKQLRAINGYEALFKKAFPDDKAPLSVNNFAKAVGAFERTLVTPAPFDSFLKGNLDELKVLQKQGLKTFIEAGCITCHNGSYVGGQIYQKFGLFEPYWKYTKSKEIDEGRYAVTGNESDKYVFKVPILRNVLMTAPYFHDGSIDKLEEAIDIMSKVELGKTLTKEQIETIISFLEALTGQISNDALTLPILPNANRIK